MAAVTAIDAWLDSAASPDYQEQPLAQDWARVAKACEEAGEAIVELIAATGQNPRKPRDEAAAARLLRELADVAWAGVLAIQHFTKDVNATNAILQEKLAMTRGRVP
jgi:sugar phosphate isomerase/epimerase